ncbi:basic-leucine zipper transcription factor family protein [Striga asiatica]|uniref:Basic-leucine zipper transcription factor family protein n=1 Tax=Striga asiatica TaxID=4170 RepID=A0A5A7PKJ3_STRAF|nr:basic-leucine zipper transcription factor family protein [Striga asiatica]
MSSSRKIINNTSSSDNDDEGRYAKITDEKKRKRMISNRESARRSRMKKEQHIKELNEQVAYFRAKIDEIVRKINEIGPKYAAIESENRVLRVQAEELGQRLELLQQLLVSCEKKSRDDVAEYVLQEPWLQLAAFQSQAVDGIYQF